MTTVHERTRSVVQTAEFLKELARNVSLPDSVRRQARNLLRHYPTAELISLAGRCEARRQEEVAILADKSGPLDPSLALWPCCEPMFIDESIGGRRLD
jgi:hypothetical protein